MKWYWSKYPRWVKILVVLAGIIGVGWAILDGYKGYNKANERSTEKESVLDASRKTHSQTNSKVLKVKGFYLAMNIDEAAELLNTKYADITHKQLEDGTFRQGASVKQLEDGTLRIGIVISSEGEVYAFMNMMSGGLSDTPTYEIEIKASSDKKVNRIFFKGNIADLLFNSKDMDFKLFAEEFAKTYGIPQFEYFIKEETSVTSAVPVYKRGYRYSSDSGYYIQISEDKDLLIKAIPKSRERGFD